MVTLVKQFAFMENSNDIPDRSPIFIVIDSQAKENGAAGHTESSTSSSISLHQTEMSKYNLSK